MSTRDLHTHSTASDGALAPASLVAAAAGAGLRELALTDHDTAAGLEEAAAAARVHGLQFIPAVEISVTWSSRLLHVVGLNIDPHAPVLCRGLAAQQQVRLTRAETIAARLMRAGVHGALEGAQRLAGQGQIGRTHFARFLVEEGHAASISAAFRRYLKAATPRDEKWATLEDALDWVHAAGGVAVLAHPLAYGFTGAWLSRAIEAFKAARGDAIEVVCGTSTPEDIARSARYARRYDLFASVGSDFHGYHEAFLRLGRLQPLPGDLRPVLC